MRKGTTTGAALRLHNSCDDSGGVSVEALRAVPGEPAQRVRTDSRVSDDEKKDREAVKSVFRETECQNGSSGFEG